MDSDPRRALPQTRLRLVRGDDGVANKHRNNIPSSDEPQQPRVLRWLRDWFTEEVEEDTDEDREPFEDVSAKEPPLRVNLVRRRTNTWYLLGGGLAVVVVLAVILTLHRPRSEAPTPSVPTASTHGAPAASTTSVPNTSSAHITTKKPASSPAQSVVTSPTAASSVAPGTCPLTQGVAVPNVSGMCASGMNSDQWQVGCESGFSACGATLQAVINCLYAANKQEPITVSVVQSCALQVNTSPSIRSSTSG